MFEGGDTLQLFFDNYTSFCTAGADEIATKQCMECLVQLVSVGKGLFSSEAQKIKWLAGIMEGMVNILRRQIGLQVSFSSIFFYFFLFCPIFFCFLLPPFLSLIQIHIISRLKKTTTNFAGSLQE